MEEYKMERAAVIDRVRTRRQPWDIVVIGGGATGAGCALDAASRGLQVLLLEQHDFGKGTSSRSTKLIHGGVRYLRQGDVTLVRQALRERALLFRNAPQIVRRQAFIIPCHNRWQKIYYGAGMRVYDLLAGSEGIGSSSVLPKSTVIDRLPNLNGAGLKGGILYYDGQFDDIRLLLAILQTASYYGASVLNYSRVISLSKNKNGKTDGVKFADEETGETFFASTKSVINATGAFVGSIRQMAEPKSKPLITFSRGIHLVFDRKFLPGDSAIVVPRTRDGRVLFCIPWHGHVLAGTTDTPINEPSLEPKASKSEIDFVLDTVGKYLAKKPGREDILSVFAGIRPLVRKGPADRTSSLSRGHELYVDPSGMVTITGGKWTTYRLMAEEAVDRACRVGELGRVQCVTSNLDLRGSDRPRSTGKSLHDELPYREDDVTQAVTNEMARTVEDVLARRTRALFLNARAAVAMAPRVAELMSAELHKDAVWIDAQVCAFRETAQNYSIEEAIPS